MSAATKVRTKILLRRKDEIPLVVRRAPETAFLSTRSRLRGRVLFGRGDIGAWRELWRLEGTLEIRVVGEEPLKFVFGSSFELDLVVAQ